MRPSHRLIPGLLALLCGIASPAAAQYGAFSDWRSHSGDNGATKYAPIAQVTADNFADLEIAWRWDTVDTLLPWSTDTGVSLLPADTVFDLLAEEKPDRWAEWDGNQRSLTRPSIRALVGTPLMVNDVLYLSTALYRAAAIDAHTGETLWVHDPKAYESGSPPPLPWRHRGLAYWESGDEARVFWGTGDGFLIGVDAKTGLPADGFGAEGRVDLTDGLPRATRGELDALNLLPIGSQSPPMGRRRHRDRRLDHQRPGADERGATWGGSAPTTPAPVATNGTFTPYPKARTSSALIPGSTTRGATPAIRMSGR